MIAGKNIDRWLALGCLCTLLSAQPAACQVGEWPSYGGNLANLKYSALDRVNRNNVKQLRIAWRWRSVDEDKKSEANVRPWLFEGTPLMVGGKLFVSTGMGFIAAIDASTGKNLWTYDPRSYATGKADRTAYTVTSPPVVVRGVVVVGSGISDARGPNASTPPGDVRGFDARTGKTLWTFHSVPRDGEFGYESWLKGSARSPRGVGAVER